MGSTDEPYRISTVLPQLDLRGERPGGPVPRRNQITRPDTRLWFPVFACQPRAIQPALTPAPPGGLSQG